MREKIVDLSKLKSVCKKIINNCAAVNKNEEVLILADYLSDQSVIDGFKEAVLEINAKLTIIKREPPLRPHDLPPLVVEWAMKGSDIIIDVSKYDILHTLPVRRALLDYGARLLNVTGHNSSTLIEPNISNIDYNELHKKALRLVKILESGNEFIYMNPKGTYLKANISGRKWYALDGIARTPGSFAVFPIGEVLGSAVPGSPNGIVFLDYLATFGKLKDTIKLTIKNGWVIKIEGGKEAKKLRQIWSKIKNSNYVGELGGIGINALNKLSGRLDAIEEQMRLGVAHIGFGDSLTYGDKVSSKMHLNGSILDIHILVDGKTIIKDDKMFL